MSEHVSTDNTLFSNIWQIVNCNTVMVWWSSTILTWTESENRLLLLWMGISCRNALIDSSSVRKLVGTFSPFAQWDRIIIALHKKICTEHVRLVCMPVLQFYKLSTYLLMHRNCWLIVSHCVCVHQCQNWRTLVMVVHHGSHGLCCDAEDSQQAASLNDMRGCE